MTPRAARSKLGVSRTTAWRMQRDGRLQADPRLGRHHNLVGQRFGALTVVGFTGNFMHSGDPIWLIRCDCGIQCTESAPNLRNGLRTHCGCGKPAPAVPALRTSALADIDAAFTRQQGRCYVSGIPLTKSPRNFVVSGGAGELRLTQKEVRRAMLGLTPARFLELCRQVVAAAPAAGLPPEVRTELLSARTAPDQPFLKN
jgi:hypothetical protein